MSVLSSFGQTGSQKPYNDLADLDEVTLTDSMIAMRRQWVKPPSCNE